MRMIPQEPSYMKDTNQKKGTDLHKVKFAVRFVVKSERGL